MDLSSISVFNTLSHDYLYLLGSRADSLLTCHFSSSDATRELVERFRNVVAMDENDLTSGGRAPGDPENRLLFASVFLWKQRHGRIDSRARLACDLTGLASSAFHRVHSYLVANGYEGVLQGTDKYTGIRFNYLARLETLVEEWQSAHFAYQQEAWSEFVTLLNVVGQQLETYIHRSNVIDFAESIIHEPEEDDRFRVFKEDDDLARLTQLFFDLRLPPDLTWPVFNRLFLAKTKRSTEVYPALLAGVQMYGDALQNLLGKVKIQGGFDLLVALSTGSGD